MEKSPEEEERLRKRAENRAKNEIYQWGTIYLFFGFLLLCYVIFVLVVQTLISVAAPLMLLIFLIACYFLFKS